jgi:hypothetical protein
VLLPLLGAPFVGFLAALVVIAILGVHFLGRALMTFTAIIPTLGAASIARALAALVFWVALLTLLATRILLLSALRLILAAVLTGLFDRRRTTALIFVVLIGLIALPRRVLLLTRLMPLLRVLLWIPMFLFFFSAFSGHAVSPWSEFDCLPQS